MQIKKTKFVEREQIESYTVYPLHYFHPEITSRIGKLFWHNVTVRGKIFKFLAYGQRQFIYRIDLVSFSWAWSKDRKHRVIIASSIATTNQSGSPIERGDRRKVTPNMAQSYPEMFLD